MSGVSPALSRTLLPITFFEVALLRTNLEHLVTMAVAGTVSQPSLRQPGYIPDNEGRSVILPGMSGIVYNVRTGDPAFGWAADHVEPGVSIAAANEGADFALHYLSCIGNEAVITSGLSAGAHGIVTGEHARMLIDFESEVYDGLSVGDTIQILAEGRGLKLLDYPQIEVKKMSPRLFEAMNMEAIDDQHIRVPVAMELPVRIMGSGAELNSEYVDQDLMSGDRCLMRQLGIDKLRLGDLVVINHADHRWGPQLSDRSSQHRTLHSWRLCDDRPWSRHHDADVLPRTVHRVGD